MQYFSKKKLVLPEGYFVNSSQIPLAKEVNKLLANCGCETFPTKPLSEAIQKSNFFFTIQSELKNKLYGFVRVTSDRGLNANLWNLSALPGNNQQLYYSKLIQVNLICQCHYSQEQLLFALLNQFQNFYGSENF